MKGAPTCPSYLPHRREGEVIGKCRCGSRCGATLSPPALAQTRSNPLAGGLLKDCGAHFPAGPGPRSPGVERGKQRGRPERSRRPPAVLPRPKRGAFGPGQRGPQGPRAPRAATAGPGADGRRKRERRGRRRDRAPEGPGSRSSGGRRGRPQAGVRWRPPQAGPTRPPEEGGSGRLSGRTSLKAEED